MTHQLKSRDIIALGFMTFALFVGAGNIIFPPMVGLQAGPHVWTAAIGFLITAVGLPVLTVVALAYGSLLEGAVLIETVFSWPGFGSYLTGSLLLGDMNAVIASCSEYTYLTQGKHVDGTMYSCTSLGVKIGGGIGTAVVGWLMELSGYVGKNTTQPQSALDMMQFMYLWLPLIFDVLILVILSKMNVEAEKAGINYSKLLQDAIMSVLGITKSAN